MRETGRSAPRSIGEILNKIVREAPWARRTELHEISVAWQVAAGEAFARRTQVVGLNHGLLTIHVESSVVRHEIEAYRKRDILQHLRLACPDRRIADLRLLLRPR